MVLARLLGRVMAGGREDAEGGGELRRFKLILADSALLVIRWANGDKRASMYYVRVRTRGGAVENEHSGQISHLTSSA